MTPNDREDSVVVALRDLHNLEEERILEERRLEDDKEERKAQAAREHQAYLKHEKDVEAAKHQADLAMKAKVELRREREVIGVYRMRRYAAYGSVLFILCVVGLGAYGWNITQEQEKADAIIQNKVQKLKKAEEEINKLTNVMNEISASLTEFDQQISDEKTAKARNSIEQKKKREYEKLEQLRQNLEKKRKKVKERRKDISRQSKQPPKGRVNMDCVGSDDPLCGL